MRDKRLRLPELLGPFPARFPSALSALISSLNFAARSKCIPSDAAFISFSDPAKPSCDPHQKSNQPPNIIAV